MAGQNVVALKRNDAYALLIKDGAVDTNRADCGRKSERAEALLTIMADLEAYRDKFGESGQRVLANALGESKRRDQNYIAVEHIISALAREEPDLFNSTMRGLAIDPAMVTQAIDKRLDSARQHVGKGFRIAPDTTDLFKRAMERARSHWRQAIEATDIFAVLSR